MTQLPDVRREQPLPDKVRISPGMQMTPNEMRTLKEKTGRTLTELLGGDAEDMELTPDRVQSMVWIELRRRGYELEWEEAGNVLPEFAEQVSDPTSAGDSTSSPDSAASGG